MAFGWCHEFIVHTRAEVSACFVFGDATMSYVCRSDDNPVIAEVLGAVLALPEETHPMMRYTALFLIGELCEWIDLHPQVFGEPLSLTCTSLTTLPW